MQAKYYEQNGKTELLFEEKPSEAVRTALKNCGYRWHKVRGVWFGGADAQTVAEAVGRAAPGEIVFIVGTAEETAKANGEQQQTKKPQAVPEELKAKIRAEYQKVWKHDTKMVDFCCGEVSRAIQLDDGTALIIEKQKLDTDFYCGWGRDAGQDYDEAEAEADCLRGNIEHFKRENVRGIDTVIMALEREQVRWLPMIQKSSYYSCGAIELSKVALYDSYVYENRIGAEEKSRLRTATGDELKRIIAAYKAEREAILKRCDAYIKRYGANRIQAHTYWADR